VQLGMVGLGRMGGNMAERLRSAGHEVVGYANDGSGDVQSLDELVKTLSAPRTVWLMVPAGSATHSTVQSLAELLEADDLVIDGGNSKFTDDTVHAELLGDHGIRYVDCGVSGGVWGRTEGYGLMAGGDPADIERLLPVFDALRPEGPREEGFVHAGPVGAGHYAKMVHNGVEYGLMQAYAEGFDLMHKSRYDIDLSEVAALWNRGSVVRSWLCELAERAFNAEGNDLEKLKGYVNDSGEGRWTVMDAIDHDVPTPVITSALYARFYSRGNGDFSHRVLAALRNQFGGHAVEKTG
jgi:6-phosphogluconate dehydrogenase